MTNLQRFETLGFKGNARWYLRDEYYYVAGRTRAAQLTLRCSESGTMRCPAVWRQRTTEDAPLSPCEPAHNHEPLPWIGERNIMFAALWRRSEFEDTALNTIYTEEAARHPDAAPHLLFEGVVSSMRNWRRSRTPPVPHTLQAYGTALQEHPRYRGLLLATVQAIGAWAIILAMEGFGECLRLSTTLLVDGTFQTVPAGLVNAAQILTITCAFEGHFFHPIVVLMSNRTRTLYDAVLQRVWQAAGHPQPQHIVADFEEALHGALESVSGLQTQGCFFHLMQALRRRAALLGLPVRQVDARGSRLTRLYGSLAMLPPNLIRLGFAEVTALAGEMFSAEFHAYFETQWLGRVGPVRLSVHGSPHRTNNAAESYHESLRRSLGSRPNIWHFTAVMQAKMTVCRSRLQAQMAGGNLRRRNRERQYLRTRFLLEQERALDRGQITLRDFVSIVSRNIILAPVEEVVPEIGEEVELGEREEMEPIQLDEDWAAVPDQNALPAAFPAPALPAAPPVLPAAPHGLPGQQPALYAMPPAAALPVIPVDPPAVPVDPPVHPRAAAALPAVVPEPPAAPICRVCLQNAPTEACLPCGHVFCSECMQEMQRHDDRCPYCREVILDTLRIYLT